MVFLGRFWPNGFWPSGFWPSGFWRDGFYRNAVVCRIASVCGLMGFFTISLTACFSPMDLFDEASHYPANFNHKFEDYDFETHSPIADNRTAFYEALHYCKILANQTKAQYVAVKSAPDDKSLAVNTKTNQPFISLDLVSRYDVIYQHKGLDAVITLCLSRRGYHKKS